MTIYDFKTFFRKNIIRMRLEKCRFQESFFAREKTRRKPFKAISCIEYQRNRISTNLDILFLVLIYLVSPLVVKRGLKKETAKNIIQVRRRFSSKSHFQQKHIFTKTLMKWHQVFKFRWVGMICSILVEKNTFPVLKQN